MGKLFVLVVEDNPDIAEIFRMAFTKCGYEVALVADGQSALDQLAEWTPHIVVLDLRLPQVSGGEVLRVIHSDERLSKSFIIITSADPKLASNYRDKADLVLIKPVTYSELRELANSLITTLAER